MPKVNSFTAILQGHHYPLYMILKQIKRNTIFLFLFLHATKPKKYA